MGINGLRSNHRHRYTIDNRFTIDNRYTINNRYTIDISWQWIKLKQQQLLHTSGHYETLY